MSVAPGFIISAPASGSGKTMVTLGLLRHFRNRGLRVASAKVGPDYIDPQFHSLAGSRTCQNLDPWAMRPETVAYNCRAAAADADLLVVEGVMGLFDGAADGTASTADLAAQLQLPIVLVIDAHGQAQSAAATLYGFDRLRPDVRLSGVIFNRLGSPRHGELLRQAVEPLGIPVLATVPEAPELEMPDRHLGLVQPADRADFEQFVERAASRISGELDERRLRTLAATPVAAGQAHGSPFPLLGRRIAVAQDAAFSFIYPHVLSGWRRAGAELLRFSPLADQPPDPAAEAVYLPGGYPELHARSLSGNREFLAGLRRAATCGVPIYGECGGYMVLGQSLTDAQGTTCSMAGLLPLRTSFARRKLHLGYRSLELLEDCPLGASGTCYRGHEFHYSTVVGQTDGARFAKAWDSRHQQLQRVGLRCGSVIGSFVHLVDRAEARPNSGGEVLRGG